MLNMLPTIQKADTSRIKSRFKKSLVLTDSPLK